MLERMDTFIYDLHSGRLDDLEFGIKALTRSPLESEKTVIVITSVLSWGETEQKLIEDIPEPQLDEDGNPIVQRIENDVIEEKPEEEKREDDETLGNVKTDQNKTQEANNTMSNINKSNQINDTQDGDKERESFLNIDEEELKRQKELEELAKLPKKKVKKIYFFLYYFLLSYHFLLYFNVS
jgi:hypothetical protein